MIIKLAILLLLTTAALAQPALPHIQNNQLIVDNKPLILLSGELHNSSPSSPAYMAPIWDDLQKRHLNSVIGAASWELVEPTPGQFNFTAVDDQVKQARAHNMHLVLIWFGSFKNASYTYAPMWVKRDPVKYPLAQTLAKNGNLRTANTLSPFGTASAAADAKAFAALMRHLKETDLHHAVVMIQVENETGLRNDSRDHSALAEAAYRAPVPPELLAFLTSHRDSMLPELRTLWTAAGAKTSGTWPEVFGATPAGDEVFMAWYTARYLQQVAAAGQKEYPLPMYANAWLVQTEGQTPGDYPSGGPVSRMMDIWHLAAPSFALFAPDIYLADFDGICASYTRENNPLFIPEARANVGNLFIALGKYRAIGYSPFGIDGDRVGSAGTNSFDPLLASAYDALGGMTSLIAKAQAAGTIQLIPPAATGTLELKLGDYTAHVEIGTKIGPAPKVAMNQNIAPDPAAVKAAASAFLHPFPRDGRGQALIIPDGPESFYIVGSGVAMTFGGPSGRTARIGGIDEGKFIDGKWTPERRINGDENYGGYRLFLEGDEVRTAHVVLYSVPN
jgi:hypothetical protein